MIPSQTTSWGRTATTWLTAGVLTAVAVLAGLGHRAAREWQRSSAQLIERRADQAASLLASALARDMRGAQASVLDRLHWETLSLDPPHEVTDLTAVAFARYPYPESFFGSRDDDLRRPIFFNRTDRWPPWMPPIRQAGAFPVALVSEPGVAESIILRIERDIAARRLYSIFETILAGSHYQVVARILYRDSLREHPAGIFGFTVNLSWARREYFAELTSQVVQIEGTESGLHLAIVDERARTIVGAEGRDGRPAAVRTFPDLFFDPALVQLDAPRDLGQRLWTVEVRGARDPTLSAATRGGNWTLFMIAAAAVALTVGLILTDRAVRAGVALTEMRSDFVSAVTHELKTPLATIRAVGDTLVRRRVTSDETLKDYAHLLVNEAKRLTRLVDNLLAYARVTDVTEVYAFEAHAPAELVDEAIQGVRQSLAAAAVELHLDVSADLPLVRADRTAICLLLDNLIDNVLRHAGERRWLSIAARDDAAGVRFEVRDRGPGIPPDELAGVQRKFVRGRFTRTEGSGLGLAIASRIAADHGSRLTIDSRLGEGTVVALTLPAA